MNFLYPYFCFSCNQFLQDGYFCEACLKKINFSIKIICPKCQRRRPFTENFSSICCDSNLKSLIYFSDYEVYSLQKLIKVGKFEGYYKIWEFLAKIIYQNLAKLNLNDFYLTYVPMTQKEVQCRGFNQTKILASELSKKLNLNLFKGIRKIKTTRQQALLKYEERLKNLEGAFECFKNPPQNIIIVDDIFTTGSTLREIAKTLKERGAKNIIGLVIAK